VTSAGTATRETVTHALIDLERTVDHVIETNEVPGLSVAVVYRDEVVHLQGAGLRTAGSHDAIDPDTVFQLASLSKSIASTVVAAIVSDSKVTWDSCIADVDPAFQLAEAYPTAHVTIRDLFAHRSGLSGNAGNDLEGLGFTREEILRRLRHLKPASSFRSTYAYSNFGLTEGGVAAAKAAGLSWEDASDVYLYEPLGMASTSSRHSDFVARTNRASLHVPVDGKWTPLAQRNPDAQSPAGGVSSTARDLAQWVRLELANGSYAGKPLIKPDAIGQTHRPLMDRGPHHLTGVPTFYGLGWNLEMRRSGAVWGHAGAFSQGARTVALLVPGEQLGIVVLTNAFPTGVPEGIADTFLASVLGGDTQRDWIADWNKVFESLFGPAIDVAQNAYGHPPADGSPALPLSSYAGTYTNDYLGTVSVIEARGGLMVKLGPGGERAFPLTHFDRDLFVYRPYDEMPNLPVTATFTIGHDRQASTLTLADLNDSGQGVLARVAAEKRSLG